jgi:hypothetical protein
LVFNRIHTSSPAATGRIRREAKRGDSPPAPAVETAAAGGGGIIWKKRFFTSV